MTDKTNRPLLGSIYLSLGMAGYVANDTLVKVASADVPLAGILVIRGAFAFLILLAIAGFSGQLRQWRKMYSKPVLARSVLDMLSTFFYLTALFKMSIASATTILQTTPLVVVLFGVFFLHEKIGWRRVAAILVGFLGVMLIIKPGNADFNVYSLLVVVTIFLVALRDAVTRSIPSSAPNVLVVLSNIVLVTFAGLVWGYFSGDKIEPSDQALIWLFTAAVLLVAATYMLIMAARVANISSTAPFRYTAILWSLLSAFFIFKEVPDLAATIGIVLIAASGIYALMRAH